MVKVQRSRLVFFVLLLPLLSLFAHAASYSISTDPITNDIFRNESATYALSISNFQTSDAEFQVYTIDPSWTVKTEPLSVVVPPGGKSNFVLSLRPTSSANYGTQGVSVSIKELESGDVVKKTLVLSLRNPDTYSTKLYAPTVDLDVMMPYDIDPRSPIPVRLNLRNRNPLNITNLSISVVSPRFSAYTTITLPPLSEKTKDIEGLSIDPLTPPAEEEVTIQLVYNGVTVNQIVKNYRIKEYTQVRQNVRDQQQFFKTIKTIEIHNDGNVKNTAVVSIPTSFVKSLFVSSDLPYENQVRDGTRVLVWTIPLDPNGTKSFSYTENYRILVLLVLLGIVGAIAYLFLRSPVVGIKEAVAIAHGDGVSDIKVRVFVKNRSARIIQGIQVTDRVPSLADVIKTESPGSLSPTKMAVSEKQGTLLRWELDVLEPFEERILTYQVKSKLKIIGRMRLPNAKIRFVDKTKERAVYSNNIELVERFRDK